jgi:hypothetical protein
MTGFARLAIPSVALAAVAALMPAAACAQYEPPSSFNAAKLSGIARAAGNYSINNPVRSDGFLRIYVLATPYGEFTVQGDQMLRMRLTELAALEELEKINNSEAYGKALAEAGLSPLKYTGRFLANPAKTMGDTFSGIGTMLDRVTSGIANAGKVKGDPLAGLLGVTDQRRKLAAKIGVDPYTDFPPLDERLSRLSEAAAAGGLTVSGAMLAIPGAAGILVSNLSTASTLEGIRVEELARAYTAAQIMGLNRQRLNAMGASIELTEALLVNRSYTPIDMATLVGALDGMAEVEDRTVFLERAVAIDTRSIAYFMRRHAELLASQQRRGARFVRFVSLGGYPFNVTREGRIVGAMPIDSLSWTQATAAVLRRSAADARALGGGGRVELRITGIATPLAKKQLQSMGWRVVEGAKF